MIAEEAFSRAWQRSEANIELLSRVPELTAERESLQTNGALRKFLLGFINDYIRDMKSENQGPHSDGGVVAPLTEEQQRLSDYFMAGYRQAMGADTGSRALGLNDDGKDMFYDSKTIRFYTNEPGGGVGSFGDWDRMVSIAINRIRDGVISSRTPEEIAITMIYEIDGRGRGWNPHINML